MNCPTCRASWPAYTIIEAARNYKRAAKIHPDTTCEEEDKALKCS